MEPESKKIRVVVAEDHLLFRETIRRLLWNTDDIEVVGVAEYGGNALNLVLEKNPDILLLDLELPGSMDGVEIARHLHQISSPIKVLVVSAHAEPVYVEAVLGEGVAGYLLKEDVSDTICDVVRGVARGERGWFSRKITPPNM
jgi:DNA-binding NarL/FixJ family response regulator